MCLIFFQQCNTKKGNVSHTLHRLFVGFLELHPSFQLQEVKENSKQRDLKTEMSERSAHKDRLMQKPARFGPKIGRTESSNGKKLKDSNPSMCDTSVRWGRVVMMKQGSPDTMRRLLS